MRAIKDGREEEEDDIPIEEQEQEPLGIKEAEDEPQDFPPTSLS